MDALHESVRLLSGCWNGQIKAVGLASKPLQRTGFAGG